MANTNLSENLPRSKIFITNMPNLQTSNCFWEPLHTSLQRFIIRQSIIHSYTIISWCGSSQLQFLEFALSSYEDISMLQFFFHFGVFSCLTFFILLSLPVDIFSCCTIFIMHFFLCCTFIMLHFLTVIIPSTFFSCLHTHFMLHFFDVAHFS